MTFLEFVILVSSFVFNECFNEWVDVSEYN